MKKLATFVASALLATGLASGANAALTLGQNIDTAQLNDGDPTLSCTTCLGLVGESPNADFTSNTEADGYVGGGSVQNIIDLFNAITNGDTSQTDGPITADDFVRIEDIPDPQENVTFTLNEGLTALKYASWVSFVFNTGTAEEVTYFGDPGLSNLTTVPVPASLFLLIGGLGALGWIGRRRGAAAA